MIDLANHTDLIEAAPPLSLHARVCVWLGRTYEGVGRVVKTLTAALSYNNLLFPRRPPNESLCQYNQFESDVIIFKLHFNVLTLSRIQMLNCSTQICCPPIKHYHALVMPLSGPPPAWWASCLQLAFRFISLYLTPCISQGQNSGFWKWLCLRDQPFAWVSLLQSTLTVAEWTARTLNRSSLHQARCSLAQTRVLTAGDLTQQVLESVCVCVFSK